MPALVSVPPSGTVAVSGAVDSRSAGDLDRPPLWGVWTEGAGCCWLVLSTAIEQARRAPSVSQAADTGWSDLAKLHLVASANALAYVEAAIDEAWRADRGK